MEVKVQYMVDLDEIPKEVVKLLPYGVDVFDNRLSNIVSLVEDASYSLSLDEIEALRVEMYKIDQRLADCQAILKGYLPEEMDKRQGFTKVYLDRGQSGIDLTVVGEAGIVSQKLGLTQKELLKG